MIKNYTYLVNVLLNIIPMYVFEGIDFILNSVTVFIELLFSLN